MSIYLDNAATTFPKPESVHQAVDKAMREIGVGPGRGGYRRGMDAARLVFEARESVAALFGIGDSSRVIFTHSATESLNLAVCGLLRRGDHVVTTSMEHNSLARPLYRAERTGVEVTCIQANHEGLVDIARVAAAIRPNTRLVALTHCSNVTGTIQPIAEIAVLAKQAGALVLVDAAQSAGVLPIDIETTGIDLLAAPGHKGLFGPQGTGILFIREGVDLEPLMVGGTGGGSTDFEQPVALPERFESGTHNTAGIAGLKAGVEFIASEGLAAIRNREVLLTERLLMGLSNVPGVRVYGPSRLEERTAVVSLTLAGRDCAEIGYLLDSRYDIQVRVGLHCSPAAHRTIGTYPTGTVRVSPGYFNTENDIDAFLEAIRELAASA